MDPSSLAYLQSLFDYLPHVKGEGALWPCDVESFANNTKLSSDARDGIPITCLFRVKVIPIRATTILALRQREEQGKVKLQELQLVKCWIIGRSFGSRNRSLCRCLRLLASRSSDCRRDTTGNCVRQTNVLGR